MSFLSSVHSSYRLNLYIANCKLRPNTVKAPALLIVGSSPIIFLVPRHRAGSLVIGLASLAM
jgi:hypothetical protein